jgi:hypothetical protein
VTDAPNNSRDKKGRFVKGERPVGRAKGVPNKVVPEIRTAAREYTEEALMKIVKIMRNSVSDDSALAAAKELLARGWGKPIAQMNLAGHDGGPLSIELFKSLPDDQQLAFLEKLAEWFQSPEHKMAEEAESREIARKRALFEKPH